MIVPIITDFLPKKNGDSLWFFYFLMSAFKDKRCPIIAPQYYFIDPAIWVQKSRKEAVKGEWPEYYLYDVPTKEDLEKITQIHIPNSLYDDCASEKGSYTDASISIHSESWEPLYRWVRGELENLQSKDVVEAIIVLSHVPAVYKAAKDLNIKVIHTEWSPLRPPIYRRMAYLDFTDLVSDNTDCKTKWQQFEKIAHKMPVLSRKALLSIFLSDEYLPLIQCLEWEPNYELGVVSYESNHPILLRYGHLGNVDMLAEAAEVYENKDILFRNRPGVGAYSLPKGMDSDTQLTPVEFIVKCRRIVCVSSNMGFESMLWGRTSYILNPNPVRFMAKTALLDKSVGIVDEVFINFYLFSYLIPYERLTDIDYLRWRLNMPPEEEIYLDNMRYYLNKLGIEQQDLFSDSIPEDILRCRGVNDHGFLVQDPYPEHIENEFTALIEIKKFQFFSAQSTPQLRLVGIHNKQFSFVYKTTERIFKMVIQTLKCAIVKIKVKLPSGEEAIVKPMNALPDDEFFAYGNPTFEVEIPENTQQILVTGEYEELETDQAATKWYAEAWLNQKAETWEARHSAQCTTEELEDLLKDRQLLLSQIDTQKKVIIKYKRLEAQHQELLKSLRAHRIKSSVKVVFGKI